MMAIEGPDFNQQAVNQAGIEPIKLQPEDGYHYPGNHHRQEVRGAKKSPQTDFLIKHFRKKQCHHYLQRDMDYQENYRIQQRTEKHAVLRKADKVFETDKFHGRNDIPLRERKNMRSCERRIKFLKPTNSMGEMIFHWWNNNTMEKITGNATKVQKKTMYGETIR
jgi:hypothetical protein